MHWDGQAELLTFLVDELCDKVVVDDAIRLGSNEPGARADVVERSAAEQLRDPPRRHFSAVILEAPRATG